MRKKQKIKKRISVLKKVVKMLIVSAIIIFLGFYLSNSKIFEKRNNDSKRGVYLSPEENNSEYVPPVNITFEIPEEIKTTEEKVVGWIYIFLAGVGIMIGSIGLLKMVNVVSEKITNMSEKPKKEYNLSDFQNTG